MVLVTELWAKIVESKNVLNDMYSLLSVEPGQATADVILKKKEIHKPDIAARAILFMKHLKYTTEYLEKSAKEIDRLREEATQAKNTVIDLQKQLIDKNGAQTMNVSRMIDDKIQDTLRSEFKSFSEKVSVNETKQIKTMENAIDKKLEKTLKSEFQSYSNVLKKDMQNKPSVSIKSIQSVVKNVVKNVQEDRDRNHNVVIFGLKENVNESLLDQVKDILCTINLKPLIKDATRFGKDNEEQYRPVRVTFENPQNVHEVLRKCKDLKISEKYKSVYISMDRNKKQRENHKVLVAELKKNIKSLPDKYWYIKGGKIMCETEYETND